MHNLNCLAAKLSRLTAEKLDVWLQKMSVPEQPAIVLASDHTAELATRLDSAKRAYLSSRQAITSTDALIERLHR